MVSLFCGNWWESPLPSGVHQPPRLPLRRRSNPMPISVPNYNRKTDRHQFGTLIGITSES
jgi:hypothetical protein